MIPGQGHQRHEQQDMERLAQAQDNPQHPWQQEEPVENPANGAPADDLQNREQQHEQPGQGPQLHDNNGRVPVHRHYLLLNLLPTYDQISAEEQFARFAAFDKSNQSGTPLVDEQGNQFTVHFWKWSYLRDTFDHEFFLENYRNAVELVREMHSFPDENFKVSRQGGRFFLNRLPERQRFYDYRFDHPNQIPAQEPLDEPIRNGSEME